ncbi:MAG: Wzz/FepE/Etk N-terminal domain-containing protein, partial [Kiritimatiellae bacterium]|nr:Wzz/FepE/Etk N-terminal domain-containing protein [Kiritimatiellia bacterium]
MPINDPEAEQSLFSRLSLADIWYVLARQKWKILIFFLLGVAGAAYIYVATPQVYQSEATLMVRYVAEEIPYDLGTGGTRVISPDSKGSSVINAEIEVLKSQEIAHRVVEELGLATFVPGKLHEGDVPRGLLSALKRRFEARQNRFASTPQAVAMQIAGRLAVENPARSNIIKVRYSASSSDLAQRVLQHIVDAYLRRHFEIHRASRAYEFLAQQVDQARARLEDTESKLRELKSQIGLYSLDSAQQTIVQRRESLWQEIREAEAQLAGLVAKRDAMLALVSNRVAQAQSVGA